MATKGFKPGELHKGYGGERSAQEGHLIINSMEAVSAATLALANIDERDVCQELLGNLRSILLGDRGYINPHVQTYDGLCWSVATEKPIENSHIAFIYAFWLCLSQ